MKVMSLGASLAAGVQPAMDECLAVVSRAHSGMATRKISDGIFRIAARVLISLKPGENIIACAGLRNDDPSAMFAMELALAIARLGRHPVLLADANFRRGEMSDAIGTAAGAGLVEMLASEGIERNMQATDEESLHFLPLGRKNGFKPSLLAPRRMNSVIDGFSSYQHVIIDAGPVLTSPYSLHVITHADVLVAVAKSDERSQRDLGRFKSEIKPLRARFLGIVLADTQ